MTTEQNKQPFSTSAASDSGSRTSLESSRSFAAGSATSTTSSASSYESSYSLADYLCSLHLLAINNDADGFNELLLEISQQGQIQIPDLFNSTNSPNSSLLHSASLGIVGSFSDNKAVKWGILTTIFDPQYGVNHQLRDDLDRTAFDILAQQIDYGVAEQYEEFRLQIISNQ